MRVIFMLLVPFLGLICASGNADIVQEVTVTLRRPMNMLMQRDSSHRLFFSNEKKYFFHPAGTNALMEVDASLNMCVLQTVLPVVRKVRVAHLPQRMNYEAGTFSALARILTLPHPETGMPVYHSQIIFPKYAESEVVALTCLSPEPYTSVTYNRILGDGIEVYVR